MELKKEMGFKLSDEKKIGHVRNQFGRNGLVANQFNKTIVGDIEEHSNISQINSVVSGILENVVDYHNLVDEYCNGEEGLDKSQDYFYSDSNADFWVRLLPVGESEYNCYIYIYHK